MSRVVDTIAVEDMGVDPLGVKEALAMAVERLGGVRVLAVDVQEPEQIKMKGASPARPAAPPRRTEKAAPGGQAPAASAPSRPKPYVPAKEVCCLYCGDFRPAWEGHGTPGQLCYGTCRFTGEPVHNLADRCAAWKEKPKG